MSKKAIRKPLSLAIGAAVLSVSGMASAGDTGADNELFTMDLLDSAYLTADAGKEGSCGEGKCGEGKCGDDKDGDDKGGEGSCGGDKGGEGSCGGDKGGEGKCGGAT